MSRLSVMGVALLLICTSVLGDEPEQTPLEESVADEATEDQVEPAEDRGDGIERPRTMSGMSVLGNEEAPKALVIVPWKSSELGDDITISDTLDDRAHPVDKEVFMRELSYYEIRSGE